MKKLLVNSQLIILLILLLTASVWSSFLTVHAEESSTSTASKADVKKDSVLYGKTALFCGDSICAASVHDKTTLSKTGWAGRIALYYGTTSTNKGKDGASVSTCRKDNRILTQINSVKNIKYDYVILHGGVNDAMDSATVGKMTDSFNVADFDTKTFAGGLEELFYYAKQYFGENSKIGYIINFKTPKADLGNWFGKTNDMSEYVKVAIQICDKWEIPYLDFYNDDNFNNNLMKVTTTENLVDYLHPNTNGYEILYKPIATWMETLGVEPVVEDSSVSPAAESTISAVEEKTNTTVVLIVCGVAILVCIEAVVIFAGIKKKNAGK